MSARKAATPPVRAARRLPTVTLPRERFELSCGATLVVSERPGAPVVAARMHIRGGPSLDPEGKEGLAYLIGRLADQGTTAHTEAELAAILEPVGGELSGDANGLGGTIVGGQWKLLLQLMAEVATSPAFPEREVEQQTRRLISRLAVERDDPRAQGGKRFRKLIYGQHWMGRPPYGSLESIQAIAPDDLRAGHAERWLPDRATIAVCGDVDGKRVKRELERLLADWKPGAPFEQTKAPMPKRAVRVDAFTRDRQQVHVYLGHLGIKRDDPDYARLAVMDHILGTGPGFTNRITRKLRDELGLAYSVHADIHGSAGLLPGTFTAYIGTGPEHVSTAVQGFLAEMRRIQDEPVRVEELETAKDYLLGSFSLGLERASRRAGYLISAEVHGFPDDHLERLPREFADVSVEDVQRVAQEHLFPDSCCLAAAGPVSKKALRELVSR